MTDAALSETQVSHGTIRYRDEGSGPTVVFLHGALVNGSLWRKVVPLLTPERRCVVPDLPLGSHTVPMRPDADLTLPGLARLVDEFLAALDLTDVTLVGNDTGGAIAQVVATNHPERLGRLVLTDCDAYDNFLPPMFRYLQVAARIPGALALTAQTLRVRALRRAPIAYGWLAKRPIPQEVLDEWVQPGLDDPAIRRDAVRLLRGVSKRYTLEAAERLASFDRPTLIVWGTEDKFFKLSHGERLAATIPDARLERIEDSRSFVPEDQPERLAELIRDFTAPAPAAA